MTVSCVSQSKETVGKVHHEEDWCVLKSVLIKLSNMKYMSNDNIRVTKITTKYQLSHYASLSAQAEATCMKQSDQMSALSQNRCWYDHNVIKIANKSHTASESMFDRLTWELDLSIYAIEPNYISHRRRVQLAYLPSHGTGTDRNKRQCELRQIVSEK